MRQGRVEQSSGRWDEPHHGREASHEPRAERGPLERQQDWRREAPVGVAVREGETGDPFGMAGDHHLRDRATSVRSDQGHLVDVQGYDEFVDNPGQTRKGKISGFGH